MNSEDYIKLDRKGENFSIEKGVKQEDPLSPNIFNSVLEEVFWKMNWEEKGIKINGQWMSNLRFADDIVLINQNADELKLMMMEDLCTCEKVGLKINSSKTKLLSNRENVSLQVGNNITEQTMEYKYLGQTISWGKRLTKELKIRTSNAWKAF